VIATLAIGATATAHADEVTFRGNYWRDRNTRVIQPEALFAKELPNGVLVGGHYLLDTITSASVAAGVTGDKPFTELRNEFGVTLGKRLGAATLAGSYSYSQESDYRAQQAALTGAIDLFQRNTTLALTLAYNHDNVYQRMGPASFIPVGALDQVHVIASWTQLISPTAFTVVSADVDVVGFGSADNGFQANPYRAALVGGAPTREAVPFQRVRAAVAAAAFITFPTRHPVVRYFALRPSFRFYWDDWGIRSYTPEVRSYLDLGPFELRVTGRLYLQNGASFYSEVDGKPNYPGSSGLPCNTCLLGSSQKGTFATADPKLSPFDNWFFEMRLLWRMRVLERWSHWLGAGLVEVSYGHLFNDRFAHTAFGDADLAALAFTFPL
jgi:Protein of unknown function (DUF3570)